MEIQRTDEETVEHLKQWLRENGMAIVIGVVIGLSGIVGVRYWMNYQRTHAEEASLIYDKISSALSAEKYGEVISNGKQLMDNYSSTSYAVLASLALAKANYAIGDTKSARANLTWILAESGDEGLKHIARVRLARLLIDAKEFSAALDLIKNSNNGAFGSLYDELRGDIYVGLNELGKARDAYRLAVVGAKEPELRQFIQMKLDNIAGENKPATVEVNK